MLDTNIVIAHIGRDVAVIEDVHAADEVLLSCVVLAELYFGAAKSAHPGENVRRLEEYAAASTVLDCDHETARRFGTLKSMLRAAGRMIPDNYIWIAAVAQQHGLTLATRDRHFDAIENLALAAWRRARWLELQVKVVHST